MSDSQDSTDAFVRGLQQLRPERTKLDSREAFFQAGFEACRARTEPNHSARLTFSIAAVAALLLASISASYHVGKTAGVNQIEERFARQERIQSLPNDGNAEPTKEAETRAVETQALEKTDERDETPAPQNSAIELAQQDTPVGVRNRSWLDPIAEIARSTWLDRQSDSVLSTSHASLFARQGALRNLSDFPFSVAQTNRIPSKSVDDSAAQPPQDASHPLAAGDFHVLAIGQEATR